MVTESIVDTVVAPLFVPATRLDRLSKAAQSGADAIIIDLEDAVAAKDKVAARDALTTAELPPLPVILRINGAGTAWFEDDLRMTAVGRFAAVMLPKSENAATIAGMGAYLGAGLAVLALVETARGIANLGEIVAAPGVRRLVFGSVDFSADIGCAHEPESLLFARAQIVLAARLGGLAAPIDGVTLAVDDEAAAEIDARRAAALGFSGKLCIHPRQVAPVLRGFSPAPAELAWAEEVLAASSDGAVAVGGTMIDAPVRRRAEQIVHRGRLLGRPAATPPR
jgi:citrate lyase subunit beta/citryl-CoA lyase